MTDMQKIKNRRHLKRAAVILLCCIYVFTNCTFAFAAEIKNEKTPLVDLGKIIAKGGSFVAKVQDGDTISESSTDRPAVIINTEKTDAAKKSPNGVHIIIYNRSSSENGQLKVNGTACSIDNLENIFSTKYRDGDTVYLEGEFADYRYVMDVKKKLMGMGIEELDDSALE